MPPVEKIAFSVDACMDTFVRAVAEQAQMLFVHHGLFWGAVMPLTDTGAFWDKTSL